MKSLKEIVEEVKELAEDAGEEVIEMFATVINKLTSTNKKVSSIPRHRWKVYTNNSEQRKRHILSDVAYCRDLQNGKKGKGPKFLHDRAYPRKEVLVGVHYATPDDSFSGWVHNVSEGGVFIETSRPLSLRTDVTLAFTMPESDIPIETKGKVMWTSKNGMGLKFKEVDESTRDKIKSALSQMWYSPVNQTQPL